VSLLLFIFSGQPFSVLRPNIGGVLSVFLYAPVEKKTVTGAIVLTDISSVARQLAV
jgi:hypothetical protein